MPYAITVNDELKAVHARAFGAGTREEGVRLIREALEHARAAGARAVIMDILELDFVPSNADASVFSGQLAEVGKGTVRVAVVAPPGAPYGVARMVAILAELSGAPVTVCTSLEEATSWARYLSGAGSREDR